MARMYFAALAATAMFTAIATGTAHAYDGSGASKYQRVSGGGGSEECEYSGVGTPDPSYYQPRDPSTFLSCTDYDYFLLGCYEGFLDDCDALSRELVGEYDDGSVGDKMGDYGWSCGHRLRWRDDWPGNSPARSCHEIDWSHG